jgi:TPR repeat protein
MLILIHWAGKNFITYHGIRDHTMSIFRRRLSPRCLPSLSRCMGVLVPPENLKGHGLQGQTGLLACLHPITRGDYVNGLIHEAASRYNGSMDEANRAAIDHNIVLTGNSRSLSTFHRAALTCTLEGLQHNIPDSQFALGVMLWKGVGVRCDMNRAVGVYLMAAEQVMSEQCPCRLKNLQISTNKCDVQCVHPCLMCSDYMHDLGMQGHARAQYNAAWSLLNGRGTTRDQSRGVAWLRAAAVAGIMQVCPSFSRRRHAGASRCPG